LMFVAFCSLLRLMKSEQAFDVFVILASFFLFVMFLGYSYFINYMGSIYFSVDGFKDSAFISVFATTYFAAYFYFIIFLFAVCRLLFYKFDWSWFLVSMVSVLFIFYSQGKNAYLAVFVSIFLLFFIKGDILVKSFLILLSCIFFYYFVRNVDVIAEVLWSSGVYSLMQASLYLNHGFSFGSVEHRYEQIYFAFEGSLMNNFFGVGLGRDILLESYVSTFVYRYGIIGFVFYFAFFVFLSALAIYYYYKTSVFSYKYYYAFIGIFFVFLHLLMISSPMFEMGKNSIFSIFLVALLFSLRRRDSISYR